MPGFFTEASGEVSRTEVLKIGKEMDLRRKFKDFVLDPLSSKCPLDSSMNQLGRWDIRRVFESLCYGKQTSKETKKNLEESWEEIRQRMVGSLKGKLSQEKKGSEHIQCC